MHTRHFHPVALACAAAISLLSIHAQAQTTASSASLTEGASLAPGLSVSGARNFEAKAVKFSEGVKKDPGSKTPTTGNVGTGGVANNTTTNGSSSTNTINGSTQLPNVSNGQLGNTGNVDNYDLQGPSGGLSGVVGGNVDNYDLQGPSGQLGGIVGNVDNYDLQGPSGGLGGIVGGAAGTGMDWVKIIQVAAPIVAGISGNQNIANVAGIVGSGAQIYGSVSSGQEMTTQNYANIGNIALQTAALGTKNPNIDQAAQLANVGAGAWNAYSALTSNTPGATGAANSGSGQPVLAGYTASGQPVFRNSTPVAGAQGGPSWGAIGAVASSVAPQLGQAFGNAQIGQAGAALGQAALAYGQTAGAAPQFQGQGQLPSSLTRLLASPGGPTRTTIPMQFEMDTTTLQRTNATLDNLLNRPNSGFGSGAVDNYDLQGSSPITAPRYDNSVDNYDLQGQSFVADPRVNNALPSGLSASYPAEPRIKSKAVATSPSNASSASSASSVSSVPSVPSVSSASDVVPLSLSVTPTASLPSASSASSFTALSTDSMRGGSSGGWSMPGTGDMSRAGRLAASQARQNAGTPVTEWLQ